MCRILAVRASAPVDGRPWLSTFAEHCRESQEFQGDGWGVSWWTGQQWRRYRSLMPIWDDEAPELPASTLFLAHARSAFRDDRIDIEHNMPFLSGDVAFAFNGELRGVRLSVAGSNGATRLLRLFDRFRASGGGSGLAALGRLDAVVAARTEYVRALNLVVSDGHDIWINSRFSEDPDYFTLCHARGSAPDGTPIQAVSSGRIDPLGIDLDWAAVPNGTTLALPHVA